MNKTSGRNSRWKMKLLSSFSLKQSIESKCRLKSAKSFKNLKKSKSKRRAVLRPANSKCRYKSVNEEDNETKIDKEGTESMPEILHYNPIVSSTSESSIRDEICQDAPKHNISWPLIWELKS